MSWALSILYGTTTLTSDKLHTKDSLRASRDNLNMLV